MVLVHDKSWLVMGICGGGVLEWGGGFLDSWIIQVQMEDSFRLLLGLC